MNVKCKQIADIAQPWWHTYLCKQTWRHCSIPQCMV